MRCTETTHSNSSETQFYSPATPSDDRDVNDIVTSMESELDQLLQSCTSRKPKKRKQNLTPEEKAGLKYLEKRVDSQTIAITSADKGGSILIVDPQMLRKKTLEKLHNPNLYKRLDKDPVSTLKDELFKIWVKGKEKSFISAEEAKYVMGVSNNDKRDGSGPTNRPSTAPHYKPGKSSQNIITLHLRDHGEGGHSPSTLCFKYNTVYSRQKFE